jgi:hypothetical protein
MKKILTAVLFLTALSAPAAISATNPYGAPAVDPAGPNETILTVVAGGKSIKYRMADLMALNPVSIQINEPFVKKRQIFSVIPLSVLLAKSGIKPNQKVMTKALNDYIYSNTAATFAKAHAFIAVERAGLPIPYDQGGPIRLVYPDSSIWSKYLDPWNWSLAEISAK